MTAKIIHGRFSGRVVPDKPREPGEETAPSYSGGEFPPGVFDLVFRKVRGRVEIIKVTLPPKPKKKQEYEELKRIRLKPEQAALTVTVLAKALRKEIAALQTREDAKLRK